MITKEEWGKMTPEQKNSLIEEKIVGKPGRYATSWTAAMWLLGYIARDRADLVTDFSRSLFPNWPDLDEEGMYWWNHALADTADWSPDSICYAAIHAAHELYGYEDIHLPSTREEG